MSRYAEGTTPEEVAYLAGMIDGEGWIGVQRSLPQGHERSLRHHLTVVVTNNATPLMDWLLEHFDGRVRRHGLGWQWIVTDLVAERLLRSCLPHLVVKQEQARLALDFRALRTDQCKGGTPDWMLWFREFYARRIREENGFWRHPHGRTLEEAISAGDSSVPLLAARAGS